MRLGGLSEVAEELGISRQRVAQLRDAPGFPAPVGEIAAGQIWDLDAVARWSESGIRRTSGRPSGPRKTAMGGRYVLDDEPLGSGGFADVYRAIDLKADSSSRHAVVAIKVLRHFEDEEVRRRFERELRLVAECSHPHIARILDQGAEPNGAYWYTMPLAKGSLADEIYRFAGNDAAIVHIMRQLCDALSYVHDEKGIYHRDLKPANILRVGKETWALADFGLAREAERTTTALTSTLGGLGTFLYAAPEQYQGAKYAGAAADIYSLGKILHELVTGEAPVGAAPDGRFRSVVQKATRNAPEQRFRTPVELLAAIERAASAPTEWVNADEAAEALAVRLRAERPDESAIDELVAAALHTPDAMEALQRIIPEMSREALTLLWQEDSETLRTIAEQYAAFVEGASFDFSFCDVVANFFDRLTLVAADDDLLHRSIRALISLGPRHNRWHVRDVVVGMLQRVRHTGTALAAAEAIQEASPDDVEWTLNDFAVRSLHPTIRDATLRAIASGQ